MFGYVNILKPELKVKDFYRYKAYYCGLCHILKERYGTLGQMTLTYDLTFLVIFLTSLYEIKPIKEEHRCLVHPAKKHDMLMNEITVYAADMNIALTYHHLKDDWADEKNVLGFAGMKMLKNKYHKIEKKYPRQCKTIEASLHKLQKFEQENSTNLDEVAGCFGDLMAGMFLYQEDRWKDTLERFGFYLGKYIYLMDAYEDLEKDIKHHSYNPLKHLSHDSDYEKKMESILTIMLADAAREYELLPCVVENAILSNILYAGIWSKYDKLRKEKEQNNDNGTI